jgi:tetraprenyl-beta-curcumene synthase
MTHHPIASPLGPDAAAVSSPAPRLVGAVAASAARQLGWGLSAVGQEVARWRALAERIPDPVLRADAMSSLAKRYYVDGAALFWILPARRDRALLSLLVAYQTIANYLDCASERGASHRGAAGTSLMGALVDAVEVDGPVGDYYADHPWRDDGGFLPALVACCRQACATLPNYAVARPLLLEHARLGRALELCHDPVPERRDAALRSLAEEVPTAAVHVPWFERAGSATSLLGVIVLLAVAADPEATAADLRAAVAAYIPWVGALSLMLDSYIDQAEDAATGSWSAIAYYPDPATAGRRVGVLIEQALGEVANLHRGDRHMVIVAAMLAMYLTSDEATAPALKPGTDALRRAGGPLTRALVPALRGWRLLYRQRR